MQDDFTDNESSQSLTSNSRISSGDMSLNLINKNLKNVGTQTVWHKSKPGEKEKEKEKKKNYNRATSVETGGNLTVKRGKSMMGFDLTPKNNKKSARPPKLNEFRPILEADQDMEAASPLPNIKND